MHDFKKWVRVDARGNKENINARFNLDNEELVYSILSELGEIDCRDNHHDLDEGLVKILNETDNIYDISSDFRL